jgi:hypothetical protein
VEKLSGIDAALFFHEEEFVRIEEKPSGIDAALFLLDPKRSGIDAAHVFHDAELPVIDGDDRRSSATVAGKTAAAALLRQKETARTRSTATVVLFPSGRPRSIS